MSALVRWLFRIAAVTIATGITMLAVLISNYLESARAIDSSAGLVVFRLDLGYVSYRPFELGPEVAIIGGGVLLLVGSALLAAVEWRRG